MQKIPANILVIDDDEDILLSAELYLKHHFSNIITSNSPRKINGLLNRNNFDVILLDMNFRNGVNDGREGLYWLRHILTFDREYIVILMTAYGDVELAVESLKMGATDFILKPWNNEKLLATISAAFRLRQSNKRLKQLEKAQQSQQGDIYRRFEYIAGDSPAIRVISRMVEKVAATEANILILGENGTGKQVIAHDIHKRSERSEGVFMHVDLGALNENLFEDELFGHAKGAFTGAVEDKPGRFELAEGGTLFLDEIGNLSPVLQSKLLTVLQNRTVTRLGESRVRPVNFRLICATNMELHTMVVKREFRQDLLYRINTVELMVPPLRKRKQDIRKLAAHFLQVYQNKYRKPDIFIRESVFVILEHYHWPGNVRELQHVMERAVIMAEEAEITEKELNLMPVNSLADPENNQSDLETMEKQMISRAIERNKGNISKAAFELGLTRGALYRRLEKYGI